MKNLNQAAGLMFLVAAMVGCGQGLPNAPQVGGTDGALVADPLDSTLEQLRADNGKLNVTVSDELRRDKEFAQMLRDGAAVNMVSYLEFAEGDAICDAAIAPEAPKEISGVWILHAGKDVNYLGNNWNGYHTASLRFFGLGAGFQLYDMVKINCVKKGDAPITVRDLNAITGSYLQFSVK